MHRRNGVLSSREEVPGVDASDHALPENRVEVTAHRPDQAVGQTRGNALVYPDLVGIEYGLSTSSQRSSETRKMLSTHILPEIYLYEIEH